MLSGLKKKINSLAWTAVGCSMLMLAWNEPLWAKEEITFAMLPQMANAITFSKWKPLLEQVEKKSGVTITQIYPKDFEEHVRLCREGKIQVAYSNPVTQVEIAPKPPQRIQGHQVFGLAKSAAGTHDFSGVIIVRADNSLLTSLEKIKGKSGWVVGENSAGGFIFQKAFLLDQGIDLSKDCQITLAPGNKQEKVIMAVYNRETDFGCIRNGMLDMLKDRIDLKQLRVLAETPKYPAWALSVDSRVKTQTAQKIIAAFLTLPQEIISAAVLPGNVESFSPASDADFNPIRAVLHKVNIEY